MHGTFIVFEGPDGSGTTTHSALLARNLQEKGHSVLHTFEATDGPVGTSIRSFLQTGDMPPNALQLLFCADRAWHEQTVIRPALEHGAIVICDRYALSTEIYGAAKGIDRQWLQDINAQFVQPDCTFLALPPFEVCMERLGERTKDSHEADDAFQKNVYDLYAAYARTLPPQHVIDTSGEKDDVADALLQQAERFLASRS